MQIHELPSGTVTDDKYFAVDDGNANYKVNYAQIAQAVGDEMGEAAFAAIANDLTTTAAGKVLDARQGKALKDEIDGLGTAADTDVVNNLTTTNEGFTLDARQGKALGDRIGGVETAIGSMNYKGFEVNANASRTFSVPANYRGFIFVITAGSSGAKGLYVMAASSGRVTTYAAVLAATNTTMDTSVTGKLTVNNASANKISLVCFSFGPNGNITAD